MDALSFESMLAASAVPVMIVAASTGKIEECNPAAAAVFHAGRDSLMGSHFLDSFHMSDVRAVEGWLDCARRTGSSEARGVLTSHAGAVNLSLSLLHTEASAFFLIHPTSRSGATAGAAFEPLSSSEVLSAVHEAPIGFLVTDGNFRVEYANRDFLRMVNSRVQDAVRGQPIGRWLRMTAVHWARLGMLLSRRRALEELTTTLRRCHGAACGVRVSAVAVPHIHDTHWGFCVRELIHLN